MSEETIAFRFIKTMKDNGLNQELIEQYSGISQSTISDMKRGKVVKKYEQFDKMLDLCKTDEQKFYVATGKHLQDSPKIDSNAELINAVGTLLESVKNLTHEITNLKDEIRQMREGNEDTRAKRAVRTHQKIPECH